MAYSQSDIERARAQAFSSAADTACNQWNGLIRTDAWCAMTGEFQLIWKNLKKISDDYHKIADELAAKETNAKSSEGTSKSRHCAKCGGDGMIRRPGTDEYPDCPACNGKGY